MTQRLSAAAVLAAFVTLGLFFLMQALVASGTGGRDDEAVTHAIDFVRLKTEQELDTKRRLPNRLDRAKPPPPPPMQNQRMDKPRADKLEVGGPSLSTSLALAGGPELGGAVADTAPIPLVRIDPIYPPRAQSRGTEGWVVVEFTITATGKVSDASVVEADPPSLFNRAALKAIRRWKYKPKIIDGQPVDQTNMRTLISFKLEK